jgi:hypothetical protein
MIEYWELEIVGEQGEINPQGIFWSRHGGSSFQRREAALRESWSVDAM